MNGVNAHLLFDARVNRCRDSPEEEEEGARAREQEGKPSMVLDDVGITHLCSHSGLENRVDLG